MILDILFQQYQTGKKLLFSSKLMNRLGRRFIGTPEELGLGILREDIRQQFYLDKVNRLLPMDQAEHKQWAHDSDLATQYRETAAPQFSKGTAALALALVLPLVGAGMVVHAAKGDKGTSGPVMPTSATGLVEKIMGARTGANTSRDPQCIQANSALAQGLVTKAQITSEIRQRCGL